MTIHNKDEGDARITIMYDISSFFWVFYINNKNGSK